MRNFSFPYFFKIFGVVVLSGGLFACNSSTSSPPVVGPSPSTVTSPTLISANPTGNAEERVSLSLDSSGSAFAEINFTSTTLTMGTKSLSNSTPGTGVYRPAVAKVTSTGDVAWLKGFQGNGTSTDDGVSVICDTSNNAYFYGDFYGTQMLAPDRTVMNTDVSGATSDAYAGKFNADGTIAWFTSFTSNQGDQVFLELDHSNNLYVVGHFSGTTLTTGGSTLTNASLGTSDVFLEKINPVDGSLIWITNFSSNSYDNIFPVFDVSGKLYVRGDFRGANLVVNGVTVLTNAASGSTDAFVARLDPSTGSLTWITGFSSNDSDNVSALTDPSGNLFAYGSFTGLTLTAGTHTLTNPDVSGTTDDAFVARLNPADGTLTWLTAVSSSSNDLATLTVDALGDVYLSGSFFGATLSAGGKTLTNADVSGTTNDNFLGRMNIADGTTSWLVGFSGPGYSGSYFYSFPAMTDSSGNVYVAAQFNGASLTMPGKTFTNSDVTGTTNDSFVAKFSSAGTLVWANNFSGAGNEFVTFSTNNDNNLASDALYVNGTSSSVTLSADGETLTNADASGFTSDAFVGRLNPADGTFEWFLPLASSKDDSANLITNSAGNLFVSGSFAGPTLTFQGNTLTNTDSSGTTQDAFFGIVVP